MTGLDGNRIYLDWNATAPLRPEARSAMLEAMDIVGNPSSVHAEGRAAKAIIEKARGQVAALVGCEPSEVVFTSGATEAVATVAKMFDLGAVWPVEHDCVWENRTAGALPVSASGEAVLTFSSDQGQSADWTRRAEHVVCLTTASGETGVLQPVADFLERADGADGRTLYTLCDTVQSVGRVTEGVDADFSIVSAHKLGGPKGVGCLRVKSGIDVCASLKGGGQEQGRRSGTENVIGIAGFGAAAAAAERDLRAGAWEPVEKLRNILEERLAETAPETIFFGQDSDRLPNTSCFAVPGWAGETQVMQMDLSGLAVSAGSACSSGKVNRASRVLLAMGFDEITASSAIRVSMGPTTTEAEVMTFASAWIDHYRRRKARAA